MWGEEVRGMECVVILEWERRMNDAGRDLIEWYEANGLAYANSFVGHAERGT